MIMKFVSQSELFSEEKLDRVPLLKQCRKINLVRRHLVTHAKKDSIIVNSNSNHSAHTFTTAPAFVCLSGLIYEYEICISI